MKCVLGPASPHTQMKPCCYCDLVIIKHMSNVSSILENLKIRVSLIMFIHEAVQVLKDIVNVLPDIPDDSSGEYRNKKIANALGFIQNQVKLQNYTTVTNKYWISGEKYVNVPTVEISEQHESKVFSLKLSSFWWMFIKEIARVSGETIVDILIDLIRRGILIDLLFYNENTDDMLKQEAGLLKCVVVIKSKKDKDIANFKNISTPEEMLAYLKTHTCDKAKTVRIPREFVNYIQLISKKFELSPSSVVLIFIMSAVTHLIAMSNTKPLGLDIKLLAEIERMNFLDFVVNHDGISYTLVSGKKMEISQREVKTSLKEIMKDA